MYIVTFRPESGKQRDEEELRNLNIKFEDILYAPNEDDKARLCEEYGIEVLFDDDPDFLVHCKQNMLALTVRNEENFDYMSRKYMMTQYNVIVHEL